MELMGFEGWRIIIPILVAGIFCGIVRMIVEITNK